MRIDPQIRGSLFTVQDDVFFDSTNEWVCRNCGCVVSQLANHAVMHKIIDHKIEPLGRGDTHESR